MHPLPSMQHPEIARVPDTIPYVGDSVVTSDTPTIERSPPDLESTVQAVMGLVEQWWERGGYAPDTNGGEDGPRWQELRPLLEDVGDALFLHCARLEALQMYPNEELRSEHEELMRKLGALIASSWRNRLERVPKEDILSLEQTILDLRAVLEWEQLIVPEATTIDLD